MSQRLRVTIGGLVKEFEEPGSYTIGRAPDCDLVISHPRVSAHHGVINHLDDGWTYTDTGSTNGSWLNGRRLEQPLKVAYECTLSLGSVEDHVDIRLEQSALPLAVPAVQPAAPSGLPTEALPPGGTMATRLELTVDGRSYHFEPGMQVVIGRRPESTIALPHPTVSGVHAVIEMVGGKWTLRDADSTNGTWIGPDRVTAPHPLVGRLQLRLGKLDDGADVEIRAPFLRTDGTVVVPAPTPSERRGILVSDGRTSRELPADQTKEFHIGRDPLGDVVLEGEQISRSHLRLAWTGAAWTVTDTSRSGTFKVDGTPLKTGVPVPLSAETKLFLGAPAKGDLITLTPMGVTPVQLWWRKPKAWGIAAAAVLAIALVGTFLTGRAPGGGSATSSADLAAVKASVVRLTMVTFGDKIFASGSGSIISADGLILTNAHVGAPTAPGQSAQYGFGAGNSTPVDYLIVGMTVTPDQPAVDTYRAKTLVADGYVDLAVVKVVAKADGSPLDGPLDLPALPMAPDDSVSVGDPITVLGFPGSSDSESVTVTSGDLSAFVADSRMDSSRAFFESTATIRHGNSGGTTVDRYGRLIGVPTRLAHENVDLSMRVRPLQFARPLIAIAEKGGDANYFSPFIVKADESAALKDWGVATTSFSTCDELTANKTPAAALQPFVVGARLETVSGVDQFAVVYSVDASGKPDKPIAPGEIESVPHRAGDCVFALMKDGLPAGNYTLAAFVGPNNDVFVGAQPFKVGGDTGPSAPAPATPTASTSAGASVSCTAGAPITSWPGNQAVQLQDVLRSTDRQLVVEGGKVLILRILGESAGYATAGEANKVAAAAISTQESTDGYFTLAGQQRWMAIAWGNRYYAVQGQFRAKSIVMYDNGVPTVVPIPEYTDRCYTPDAEYRVEGWHAIWYESDPLVANPHWLHYDSVAGTISVFQ